MSYARRNLVHEQRCHALAHSAALWTAGNLADVLEREGRGLPELEKFIYWWLMDHAVFPEVVPELEQAA